MHAGVAMVRWDIGEESEMMVLEGIEETFALAALADRSSEKSNNERI